MLKPQQIKYVTKRLEDDRAKTIKILKTELKVERKVLGLEVIANFSKCCEDLLQLNEEHISITH